MVEDGLSDATEQIKQAFYAYEEALTSNLIEKVNAFFLHSPAAARFGVAAGEHQYGCEAIVRARLARGPVAQPKRTLVHVHVQAVSKDVGLAHAEYIPEGHDVVGRQSQTWLRTPSGWKIVSAHVSFGVRAQ